MMTKADKMREMMAQGLGSGEIARRLGISVQEACNFIWRERNRARFNETKNKRYAKVNAGRDRIYEPWDKERRRRLQALRKRGLTFSELAEKFGTTRGAIAGQLHRMGS